MESSESCQNLTITLKMLYEEQKKVCALQDALMKILKEKNEIDSELIQALMFIKQLEEKK